MLATRVNDMLSTTDFGQVRADALIAGMPARAWRRSSVVAGRIVRASTTGAGADPRFAG
ncbi:hypothetical protein [Lentzea jiangxiensis]|uniref:hypothetical protein n=1 Tax=Lentzea jiangxiensis TaxID=641025 RepID=UPI0015A2FEB5|nr:hypothetical protein [Lentzea jiangxiensis]